MFENFLSYILGGLYKLLRSEKPIISQQQYLNDAIRCFAENRFKSIDFKLANGMNGKKILGNPGGIYTEDGKIVTFWYIPKALHLIPGQKLKIFGDGYVDFCITDNQKNYGTKSSNLISYSLEETIFSVFADCFEKANKKFNYYGPTIYKQRELQFLLVFLEENIKILEHITSPEMFVETIKKLGLGSNLITYLNIKNEQWLNRWQTILDDLKNINNVFIEMVNICLATNKIFGVYGV